jgi:TonB family protein
MPGAQPGWIVPCRLAKFRPGLAEKPIEATDWRPLPIGKAFATSKHQNVPSMSVCSSEVYSARELALAAGVPIERVVAALGGADSLVGHNEAVRVGRTLLGTRKPAAAESRRPELRETNPIFSAITNHTASQSSKSVSFALSSTVHAGLVAGAVLLTTMSLAPAAAVLPVETPRDESMRAVYLNIPGPGGGGGGSGLRQPAPPPKALREGRRKISGPVPIRRPPPRLEPAATPPEPPPVALKSEPLPVLAAPIVTAPADDRDRLGVFEQAKTEVESHGPGQGGGAGTGQGTGVGPGDGAGLGPGSGGGTGGGPFRPGSGIEAPRLLREVKADYTEEARRRGLAGEVVMEIVVTRTGSVGDVKIVRRLGSGLDERAVQAVRQWRFAPATRHGTPVDVLVEVAVEFKLR